MPGGDWKLKGFPADGNWKINAGRQTVNYFVVNNSHINLYECFITCMLFIFQKATASQKRINYAANGE